MNIFTFVLNKLVDKKQEKTSVPAIKSSTHLVTKLGSATQLTQGSTGWDSEHARYKFR
jgi:hypothetical protein